MSMASTFLVECWDEQPLNEISLHIRHSGSCLMPPAAFPGPPPACLWFSYIYTPFSYLFHLRHCSSAFGRGRDRRRSAGPECVLGFFWLLPTLGLPPCLARVQGYALIHGPSVTLPCPSIDTVASARGRLFGHSSSCFLASSSRLLPPHACTTRMHATGAGHRLLRGLEADAATDIVSV